MKYRWIARVVALALLMASVTGFAGVAEGFGQTPSTSVKLGRGETCKFDTSAILVADGQVLKYKSNNPKVATVDADGVITALRKGKATIAVGYDKTLLGVCHVTVVGAPRRVTLSDSYAVLSVGDVKALTAKLPGGSASALSFTSSNEKVATVDGEGNVTAIAGGKATVTVTTYNDRTATCDVYVLGGKAPTTLSLNVPVVDIQVGETFRLVAQRGRGQRRLLQVRLPEPQDRHGERRGRDHRHAQGQHQRGGQDPQRPDPGGGGQREGPAEGRLRLPDQRPRHLHALYARKLGLERDEDAPAARWSAGTTSWP